MIEIRKIEYAEPVFGQWVDASTPPEEGEAVLCKCVTKEKEIYFTIGCFLYSLDEWLLESTKYVRVLEWTPLPREKE